MLDVLMDWGQNHLVLLGKICLGSVLSTLTVGVIKILSIKKRSDAVQSGSER